MLLIDFASAFEEVVPKSILFTAAPRPKIDLIREIITDWAGETDVKVNTLKSKAEF